MSQSVSHSIAANRVQGEIDKFLHDLDSAFANSNNSGSEILLSGRPEDLSQAGTQGMTEAGFENMRFIYDLISSLKGCDLTHLQTVQLSTLNQRLAMASELFFGPLLSRITDNILGNLEDEARAFSMEVMPIATFILARQKEPVKVLTEYREKLARLLKEAQTYASQIENLQSESKLQNTALEEQNQIVRKDANDAQASLQNVIGNALEEINKTRDTAEELRTGMEARVKQIIGDVEVQAKDDFDRLAEPMKALLQNASAEVRRKAFVDEAKGNNLASIGWLIATIVMAVILVYFGVRFYEEALTLTNLSVANVVELTAIRLIILSTLSLGVVFCSRNFASSRHNYVINKHRSNALATFEAFAEGASDPDVKNAILLQAAQSIFTPQTSGFIRNEPDPSSNTQIIRVLEDLTKSTKP